jgi:hypothetical protein
MKLFKTSLMLLILIQALAGQASAQEPGRDYTFPRIAPFRSAGPGARPRIVVRELPSVPASLSSYRLEPAEVNEAYVRRIASALGMQLTAGAAQGGRWSVSEAGREPSEKRRLTVFEASGALTYMLPELIFAPAETQPALPSEAEALDLAVRFLREADLLPADARTGIDQVRFSRTTATERDTQEGRDLRQIVTNIEVRFPRTLDGYEVRGPGAKLYVAFGEKGRIVGVTKVWRASEKADASLPAIQPEEAIRLLQDGAGVIDADPACAQAEISRMEVVYWMMGPKDEQRSVLPAYRLEGRCLDESGRESGDFQAYAPAVRNPPVPTGGSGE